MRGTPYFMRLMSGLGAPDDSGVGVDFAGTVEAVGSNVERFKAGDEVFGGGNGVFAEYITIREDGPLAMKPAGASFEQAASTPIAALTALQALRDIGKLQPGQKVLINGASGGVGTFAVQIAKSFGAEVTGVCSTRNVEMVRSLGADHIFDYKKEDYTESGEQYDLIVDMVSNHSLSKNKRALKPNGILVIVGGGKGNWLGPMMNPIKALLMSPFVEQEIVMILAQLRKDDLAILADLMQNGKVTPVIDRRFRLNEVPAALAVFGRRARARENNSFSGIVVAARPRDYQPGYPLQFCRDLQVVSALNIESILTGRVENQLPLLCPVCTSPELLQSAASSRFLAWQEACYE